MEIDNKSPSMLHAHDGNLSKGSEKEEKHNANQSTIDADELKTSVSNDEGLVNVEKHTVPSMVEQHETGETKNKKSTAENQWRRMCMEENDEVRKIYEERPYQVEIIEKALQENTIVCLGTGTGKTFISATVIKEMQGGIKGTYKTNGKRTFFLVNTGKDFVDQLLMCLYLWIIFLFVLMMQL